MSDKKPTWEDDFIHCMREALLGQGFDNPEATAHVLETALRWNLVMERKNRKGWRKCPLTAP